MSVTISDILTLDLLKSANIVAGKSGLLNEIHRVNFSDCPLVFDEISTILVSKGDLFINSLYLVKDNETELMEVFKYFITTESAGVIVINEYFESLPDCVLDLADRNNFPVIFVDNTMSYAELIRATMEMILSDQSDIISEMKIDQLLDQNISTQDILQIYRHLNGQFSSSYQACFVKFPSNRLIKVTELRRWFKENSHIKIFKYHDFFLFIINHEENISPGNILQNIKNILNSHTPDYHAGISNIFETNKQLHISIKQAYAAFDLESYENTNFISYSELSVYKLLYPLKNTPVLSEFYNEVIGPLEAYDQTGNTDLLLTCKAFLKNNADYKLTAREIHQHENTIRYRITKARALLNLENDNVKFIELLSIGFKINNLINSKL